MKDEREPVSPDEFVHRLIWRDYFLAATDPAVNPRAFQPRPNETDGISAFRTACLADPADILGVIAAEKRAQYAIAQLPVAAILALGLTVWPAPIATVPGHAVLPELNSLAVTADVPRWKVIQKQLAEIASAGIIRRPSE